MAKFLSNNDENAFTKLIVQKIDKELLKAQKRCEKNLQKGIARNNIVSKLYERPYRDNAIGKVGGEWFMQFLHKHEVERAELKSKIVAFRKKLSEFG